MVSGIAPKKEAVWSSVLPLTHLKKKRIKRKEVSSRVKTAKKNVMLKASPSE